MISGCAMWRGITWCFYCDMRDCARDGVGLHPTAREAPLWTCRQCGDSWCALSPTSGQLLWEACGHSTRSRGLTVQLAPFQNTRTQHTLQSLHTFMQTGSTLAALHTPSHEKKQLGLEEIPPPFSCKKSYQLSHAHRKNAIMHIYSR